MNALVLRLDAPMLSFGSVMVDQNGFIDRFPGQAMLVGLFANALGWDHSDHGRLTALQDRLEYAARWDVPPQEMVDYQTVDLAQPKMQEPFWTTWGIPEKRAGGNAGRGTHQRYRYYWTDGIMTVVVTLKNDEDPDLPRLAQALNRPARPLFFGRKVCLPARPVLDPHSPVVIGADLLSILKQTDIWNRDGEICQVSAYREACWPANVVKAGTIRRVHDLRDWSNQIMAGGRERREGIIGREEP
ncbi:MAG: type I-E CRISPR-associated protein Cas5/CasD [Sulfobacillus acidophilus]|uniref:Type I-E CRISPR-associated protein Cas5/CasD n=1 Tax=Sulfobacillus acidophilus TaxID=53633 RepID=A0A2T2WE16_9FIRM|nr:MAG: type I-E CRISPR-associated protein Cas5/CasD [Sulfobacillus acidophilus]